MSTFFTLFFQVRKLEAYMLAFRDYANLVIMEITPLLEYYCTFDKDGAKCKYHAIIGVLLHLW